MGAVPALEIAVTSSRDAAVARSHGADRVELCQALEVGGVGPTVAQIEHSVAEGIPVHVLIRARPGDFVYDDAEVRSMEADAADAIARGASGVVIGALTGGGVLDIEMVTRLVEAAGGAEVTLHRAVDRSLDPVASLELAAGAGIRRVLTSGGHPTVGEGLAAGVLPRMIRAAAATGIELMAGGGLVLADVEVLRSLGASALHLSASASAATGRPDPLDASAGPHRAVDGGMVEAFDRARRGT